MPCRTQRFFNKLMRKKTTKKTTFKKSPEIKDDPFQSLVEIMERLRGKRGCPWDREQTRQSIKPYLLEEAYELLEALDKEDTESIKEELGDLLFQILFHAQIAKEKGEFDIQDVLKTNREKMLTRHPHVFGNKEVSTSREVLVNWEEIKKNEAKNKKRESILDGVPYRLPALLKAYRFQEKASRVGFDWDNIRDVTKKIEEELGELKRELSAGKKTRLVEEEIGDLLFSIVNLSRFIKINPEEALKKTIDKFKKRFQKIEKELSRRGKNFKETTLEEMDEIWNRAKREKKP